jgi:gas vesicle protein
MTQNADHDRSGTFVMGLLAGTMLGAGLGLLLAPKSGTALRTEGSGHANAAGHASEGYRRTDTQ